MLDKTAEAWEVAQVAVYLLFFLANNDIADCGNDSQIVIFSDNESWTPFPIDPVESISISETEADFKALQ